jgi:hypothetical protein
LLTIPYYEERRLQTKKTNVLYLVLTLLAVLSLTSIAAAPAKEGAYTLTTWLSGAAEVPGPGDPDGSGHATIRINYGQGRLCWNLRASDITLPATAAHIHVGGSDVAGPVVVHLSAPSAKGASSGCSTVDKDLLKQIIENPAGYYVNVHNSDYPAGAVRGQLELSAPLP